MVMDPQRPEEPDIYDDQGKRIPYGGAGSHRALGIQFDPYPPLFEHEFDRHGQGALFSYKMPISGTTEGDEGLPLYRGVVLRDAPYDPSQALESLSNAPERKSDGDESEAVGTREPGAHLGRHWTHDLEYAREIADTDAEEDENEHSTGVVIEADHPGKSAVIDWDKDRDEAEGTIVARKFQARAMPEVPIRAGSAMKVRAVHLGTPGGKWERHPANYEGRA